MLNNTKLRHFWAQIVSWAPRHARKTFIVSAPGHWPNKHRTNLGAHRPKWKEVYSTSHTKIERPTSGSGRGQKSSNYTTLWEKWNGLGQGISTASKTTDGPRVWPLGDYEIMTRKDYKGDQPSGGETTWPGQILERHDMAEDSTRHGNLETACWGLRRTTGHNDCLMMMMMIYTDIKIIK